MRRNTFFVLLLCAFSLTVGCGARQPSADGGHNDAGSNDAGSNDAGSNDAGSNDAGSNDAGSNDAGSNDVDAGSNCDSTHAMVGWVADMPLGFHASSGTATIIDDCTIEVTQFNFDGGGVVVHFYGGAGGDYRNGFAISENIFGTVYSNETVILTLPAGRTFDDMDSISVWCVEFGVSFTDAMFVAP
jgi:hypothetical protein